MRRLIRFCSSKVAASTAFVIIQSVVALTLAIFIGIWFWRDIPSMDSFGSRHIMKVCACLTWVMGLVVAADRLVQYHWDISLRQSDKGYPERD